MEAKHTEKCNNEKAGEDGKSGHAAMEHVFFFVVTAPELSDNMFCYPGILLIRG